MTSRFFWTLAFVATVVAEIAPLEFPIVRKPGVLTTRPARPFENSVPLKGPWNSIGEYYVEFSIGSPGVTFTAQLDTGSSDLSLADITCPCKVNTTQVYDPAQSSTSQRESCSSSLKCQSCVSNQCSYQDKYGDGSGFTALVYEDNFNFPGGSTVTQAFGAITQESRGFEPDGIDGIMGFAYQELSAIGAKTTFENLVDNGLPNIFSMCMGQETGVLTLGAAGTHYSGGVAYTPITRELYYQVYGNDILVGGTSIGVSSSVYNNQGTIVDSGTTLIILPTQAMSALISTMQNNCSSSNLVGLCGVSSGQTIFDGYCFPMSSSDVAAYPTLTFKLGRDSPISLDVEPQTYLLGGFCSGSGSYTAGIVGASGDGMILGDVFMQNFENIFDRQNKRMGFAKVRDCQ